MVARELPVLKGKRVYEFLMLAGYPAAVPSSDSMRWLHRVGLMGEPADDVETRRGFFDQMHRVSHLTNTKLSELSFLVGTFTRGDTDLKLKAICSGTPRCTDCAISSHCVSFRESQAQPRARIIPIKEWAVEERPRERLLAGERLSSAELIALILRTGSGAKSAVELGRELINHFGSLHALAAASAAEIQEIDGIGPAKAAEIVAAIELGRRVAQPASDVRDSYRQVNTSRDIFDLYRARYKTATQEEFLLLALNTKNKVQKEIVLSRGTLNSSIVHPRDVFGQALKEAAAGLIFVHNHPSGDPAPSAEDHALTRRLVEIGNLLGIKVLDHIIIGAQRYFSFSDEGLLG